LAHLFLRLCIWLMQLATPSSSLLDLWRVLLAPNNTLSLMICMHEECYLISLTSIKSEEY
jgi:hypothetical protein